MDNLHKLDNEVPVEHDDPALTTKHYTIDQAIADVLATLDSADDTGAQGITDEADDALFPDPFTGDHHIEYWIWTGGRLVPATPDQAERLCWQETLEAEELRSRRERQRANRQQRWQSYSQVVHYLAARLKTLNSQ
jgi:hypothetical protein